MTSAVTIYVPHNFRLDSSRWLEDGSGFGGNATCDFFTAGAGIGAGNDSVHDGSSLVNLLPPLDDLVTDPLILEVLQCE